MADDPAASPSPAPHLYGGQAVVEGVMMRGARHWAVAVRRPAGDIHLESHDIESVADRHPILRKPLLRGVIVLGQSLAIGMRALMIAANQSVDDDEQLTSRQIGVSLAIAMLLFIGVFILGPTTLFTWVEGRVGEGVPLLIGEGVFRVLLFVGYLWLIGRTKDIHRVFEYHGAEHKTIAAYEHGDELVPEQGRPLPEGARPLRHELPDHRDDHHDLRVHAVRDTRACSGGSSRGSSRSRSSPASRTRPCGWGRGSTARS